jgi:methyl-accepting chemotaxis protein
VGQSFTAISNVLLNAPEHWAVHGHHNARPGQVSHRARPRFYAAVTVVRPLLSGVAYFDEGAALEPTDLTIVVLKEIRDEVRALGTRIDSTNERIDGTNARVDGMNERINGTNERLEELSRRVVESEIRTSTAIADLAGTVRDMTSVLRAANDLRPRVERCEQDIAEMKRRVR